MCYVLMYDYPAGNLCSLMPIYTQVIPNPSYVIAKQTNLDLVNLKIYDSKKIWFEK